MKRNEWMALIVTSFMMMAVCLSAQAKVKKTVERGMTKQEVVAILGQPKLTNFDAYGDRWEYYKMNALTGESKRIVVCFDLNGRVVAYETKYWDNNTNSEIGNCNQRPAPPYGAGAGPDGPAYYGYCLDDASFSRLYNKVKNASFDDNKFDLIEVASLGCFYSCSQTARMMKMFTFSDKQLKVLRLMAPHIVDPENAIAIYDVLTFDSEKSKAGQNIKVTSTALSVYNERQKVSVSLNKAMEQDETYGIGNNKEITSVQFGIFADEDVKAADDYETIRL